MFKWRERGDTEHAYRRNKEPTISQIENFQFGGNFHLNVADSKHNTFKYRHTHSYTHLCAHSHMRHANTHTRTKVAKSKQKPKQTLKYKDSKIHLIIRQGPFIIFIKRVWSLKYWKAQITALNSAFWADVSSVTWTWDFPLIIVTVLPLEEPSVKTKVASSKGWIENFLEKSQNLF